MLIKTAALMALAKKVNPLQNLSMYKLAVSLEILITDCSIDTVRSTSLTFSKLQKDEYATEIETINGVNVSNNATIPQEQASFNHMFCCKVKQLGIARS